MTLIKLTDITKTYHLGDQTIEVLRGVSLDIHKKEFVSIMGQSGSGKSTLMNIVGLLDTPTTGSYLLDDQAVEKFNETKLTTIRRRKIGFVFQQYNLLPRMTTLEQVLLPLEYQGIPRTEREARAREALNTVGLSDRLHNKPNELSGGQQQRVSIARALVSDPEILLADEPTGALDSHTGTEVMNLLTRLNEKGHTIVIITHEKEIAAYAKKIIHISDGKIIQNP